MGKELSMLIRGENTSCLAEVTASVLKNKDMKDFRKVVLDLQENLPPLISEDDKCNLNIHLKSVDNRFREQSRKDRIDDIVTILRDDDAPTCVFIHGVESLPKKDLFRLRDEIALGSDMPKQLIFFISQFCGNKIHYDYKNNNEVTTLVESCFKIDRTYKVSKDFALTTVKRID